MVELLVPLALPGVSVGSSLATNKQKFSNDEPVVYVNIVYRSLRNRCNLWLVARSLWFALLMGC